MTFNVIKKHYDRAPINYGEIIRYAGAKTADNNLRSLIDGCIKESEEKNAVNFSVCFTETPLYLCEIYADFSAFKLKSRNLVKSLCGANSALVFACTVGIGIDRLISKYAETDPTRALIFQAFGAERVETFIDLFIAEYGREKGFTLTPRFSPGYGDLPLKAQKDLFALLSPEKHIGLTLNESLIMSPSKSVTAIAGIKTTACKTENSANYCTQCGKADCEYRK